MQETQTRSQGIHRDAPATALEHLHGRRARLLRELAAAEGRGVDNVNQRNRLLRDIGGVEDEIRLLTRTRFGRTVDS